MERGSGLRLDQPKFVGGDLVALLEILAGPWEIGGGVFVGVVDDAELNGIDFQRDGEFVEGGFEGEGAGAFAGGAHEGGGGVVEADDFVGKVDVGAVVEQAAGAEGGGFEVVGEEGGILHDFVADGGEFGVGRGGEGEALEGLGAVADAGEHAAAGDVDFDRAVDLFGSEGGGEGVGPLGAFAAEASADEGAEDADIVARDFESFGEAGLDAFDPLGGVVDDELVVGPERDGGGELHRVVMFDGGNVGGFDFDGVGLGEGSFGIAAFVLEFFAHRFFRVFGVFFGGGAIEDGRGDVIFGGDECGGVAGLIECGGDDESDVLAGVGDFVVDEGHAHFAEHATGHEIGFGLFELGGVFVGDDGEDAGRRLGAGGVDAADAAAGDGGVDEDAVGGVVGLGIGSVDGGAGDFQFSVGAAEGLADGFDDGRISSKRIGHGRTPEKAVRPFGRRSRAHGQSCDGQVRL